MVTSGYAAPEYIATGHLYVKSDVYGFGVVLLELLTGLRALDLKRPSRQQNLVEWMRPFLSQRGKLKLLMDSRMEGWYSFKAALETAQLALKCLASEPKHRPPMKAFVEVLSRLRSPLLGGQPISIAQGTKGTHHEARNRGVNAC